MKRFTVLAVVLFTLMFSTVASAQWFPMTLNLNANKVQITASVYNNLNYRILCRGTAQGITWRGLPLYAYFNDVVLYPGQNAYAYVYTNMNDPFVNWNGNVQCMAY